MTSYLENMKYLLNNYSDLSQKNPLELWDSAKKLAVVLPLNPIISYQSNSSTGCKTLLKYYMEKEEKDIEKPLNFSFEKLCRVSERLDILLISF